MPDTGSRLELRRRKNRRKPTARRKSTLTHPPRSSSDDPLRGSHLLFDCGSRRRVIAATQLPVAFVGKPDTNALLARSRSSFRFTLWLKYKMLSSIACGSVRSAASTISLKGVYDHRRKRRAPGTNDFNALAHRPADQRRDRRADRRRCCSCWSYPNRQVRTCTVALWHRFHFRNAGASHFSTFCRKCFAGRSLTWRRAGHTLKAVTSRCRCKRRFVGLRDKVGADVRIATVRSVANGTQSCGSEDGQDHRAGQRSRRHAR